MPGRIINTDDQTPSPEVPPGTNLTDWALSRAPATPPPPPPANRSSSNRSSSGAAETRPRMEQVDELAAARARARERVESAAQIGRQQLANGSDPDGPTSLAMAFLERLQANVVVAGVPVNAADATTTTTTTAAAAAAAPSRSPPPPPSAPAGARRSSSELRLPSPAWDGAEARERPYTNGHRNGHDDPAEYAAVDFDRVGGEEDDGRGRRPDDA